MKLFYVNSDKAKNTADGLLVEVAPSREALEAAYAQKGLPLDVKGRPEGYPLSRGWDAFPMPKVG